MSAMLHHGHSGRGGDGGGVDGGHRGLERIALPARVGEREAGLCEECRAGLGLGSLTEPRCIGTRTGTREAMCS